VLLVSLVPLQIFDKQSVLFTQVQFKAFPVEGAQGFTVVDVGARVGSTLHVVGVTEKSAGSQIGTFNVFMQVPPFSVGIVPTGHVHPGMNFSYNPTQQAICRAGSGLCP